MQTAIRLVFLVLVILLVGRVVYSQERPDEREDRIQEGQRFLSASRLSKWESYFTDGVERLGKIVLKSKGRTVKESWIESDFMLIKTHHPDAIHYTISNPDYSAMLIVKDGENELKYVGPSVSDSDFFQVTAIPFAVCSSVNFSRRLVPREMEKGNLVVQDYELRDGRHYLSLGSAGDLKGEILQLVFASDASSILPEEAIHDKGSPHSRHFVNSQFTEVEDFLIPLRLDDMNSGDHSTTEVFPDDRLERDLCYLSHYGLPEPGEIVVTDFGEGDKWWRYAVLSVLAIIIVVSGAFIWSRMRAKGGG